MIVEVLPYFLKRDMPRAAEQLNVRKAGVCSFFPKLKLKKGGFWSAILRYDCNVLVSTGIFVFFFSVAVREMR